MACAVEQLGKLEWFAGCEKCGNVFKNDGKGTLKECPACGADSAFWTDLGSDTSKWNRRLKQEVVEPSDPELEKLEEENRCTEEDAVCSKVFASREDYCDFCAGRD